MDGFAFDGPNANSHYYRDLFFPSYDLQNAAPQQALEHTMLQTDVNSNMPIGFGEYQQFTEQLPKQQLQLDGTYRARSSESPSTKSSHVFCI
jgi:hypothetical protein